MKFIFVILAFLPGFLEADVCRITSQTDFSARPTSASALSETRARKCLVFQNNGASTVYIKFDSAHSGTENYSLASGATWMPIVCPVNAVYIRSAAGTVLTTVLEGK